MELVKIISEETSEYMSKKYSDWTYENGEINEKYKDEYDKIYMYFYRVKTFCEGDIITGIHYEF